MGSDSSLARLSRVRGLRVVILVQDPVAVAEHAFVQQVGRCNHTLGAAFYPPTLKQVADGIGGTQACKQFLSSLDDKHDFVTVEPLAFQQSRRIKASISAFG